MDNIRWANYRTHLFNGYNFELTISKQLYTLQFIFFFYLQILTQDVNPGIKYEYLLPVNSIHNGGNSNESSGEIDVDIVPENSIDDDDSAQKHTLKSAVEVPDSNTSAGHERRKKKFLWKVVGFNQCSKSCGGGTQAPIIRCVRENPTKFFVQKRCAHLPKPSLGENILRCNTQPCPAFWKIDDWSPCNCGKFNEQEHQTRSVECVQELGSGTVIQVNKGACLEQMPSTRNACKCKPPANSQTKNEHHNNPHHKNRSINDKNHKHRSGGGNFKPPATLVNSSAILKYPHVAENKKSGVWLSSDWGQQVKYDIELNA